MISCEFRIMPLLVSVEFQIMLLYFTWLFRETEFNFPKAYFSFAIFLLINQVPKNESLSALLSDTKIV